MVACITRNPGTMLVAAPDLGHETICHLSIISGHQDDAVIIETSLLQILDHCLESVVNGEEQHFPHHV